MNITVSEYGEITVNASELCGYLQLPVGIYPRFSPCEAPFTEREMPCDISHRMIFEGETFIIKGSHDGVCRTKNGFVLEKIKKVRRAPKRIFSDSPFVAESCILAYLLCCERQLDSVFLQLSYYDSKDNMTGYRAFFTVKELKNILCELLGQNIFFAKLRKDFLTNGLDQLKNLPFPYKNIRDGQREFITKAYKTVKNGKRMLAVAPTGIGKTISAMYPALKALAVGRAEKIFYLTAKTVTGKAASETITVINKYAPSVRAITVVAKERLCPSNDKKNPFTVNGCSHECPRLCDSEEKTYSARVKDALKELLSSGTVYESARIKAIAEKHFLCPYELSLDLSEYCQLIICDYNYAFDSRIKFRRYFCTQTIPCIFLVDEAHNLPDRVREMYGAYLELSMLEGLRTAVSEGQFFNAVLLEKVNSAIAEFDVIKNACEENTELGNSGSYGYCMLSEIPKHLLKSIESLSKALYDSIKLCTDETLLPVMEKCHSQLSEVIHAAEFFDESFVLFGELMGESVRFKIICLDPSGIIDSVLKSAVSSILFSATLTPTEYFADLFGCKKATVLELPSPYDPKKLCLAAYDGVSTRYATRGDTAKKIAEIICTTVNAKHGNYMVYFPSYDYMNKIVREFLRIAPKNIKAVAQKSGMSVEARAKFLSFFENGNDEETLVGFCVLGGIFSEGIDLPDKMLIGAVLVGIGLPGISSELNILKDYYDRTREDGHGFAYLYPGMIKILQAAGRVIRSEDDRGTVVLIDERYRDPKIQKLLPPHWSHIRYIGDTYSLSKYLNKFWSENQ